MKLYKLSISALMRDWRSGELHLVLLAVIISVSAVTTVSFFTDRVKRATELESNTLLAADLVLASPSPINSAYDSLAEKNGLDVARTTSFRSVAVVGERLELTEVKAVDPAYPLYGELRTASELFGEEKVTDQIPASGEAWLDSRLFQLLAIDIGDSLSLGSLQLRVTQVLTHEPDRGGDLFNIAPRVLINRVDLPRSGLLLPGSRAKYRLLIGGSEEAISSFRSALDDIATDNIEIQGIRDARPELKTALNRAEQFLGLAVLSSIALAGLAIALSAQRFASRHFDHCAIMRCLGMQRATVFRFYLYQLFTMALLGSLLGCFIGYVLQFGLAGMLSGLSQVPLPPPSVLPVFQGLLAGVITILGFALPPLLRLNRVSPLRVLRRDLTPLPVSLKTAYLLPVMALALLSPWQTGQFALTFYTLLGIAFAMSLLALGARLFLYVLNHFRPRLGVVYRYGLANIQRRSRQSSSQIVAIGLGITVMLLLTLIRTDLLDNWQNRLPEGTPNYFLINIQPDDIDAVRQFVKLNLEKDSIFYPMIRGRLVSINDQEIKPDDYVEPRAQRLAAREFNLSWTDTLPADNEIIAGKWWANNNGSNVFSVEEGIAETLDIRMNDVLTYRVAGNDISGKVVNIRALEWDSFNVNFFVISNPVTLKDAPTTYITSFYLPGNKRHLLADLVRSFPSTTVIDVDAILTQVRRIMYQVIDTIEYVFVFTLLSGIVVLLAALKGVQDERIRETALLFALGARHRHMRMSLLAEFTYLGVIAGMLAAFAASISEWLLGQFVLDMDTSFNLVVWLIAPLLCAIIIAMTGMLYTRSVFAAPPLLTLRQE